MSFESQDILMQGYSLYKEGSAASFIFELGLPRCSYNRESHKILNDEDIRVKRNDMKNLTVKPLKRSRFENLFQSEQNCQTKENGQLIPGVKNEKPQRVEEKMFLKFHSSQMLNIHNSFQFFDKCIETKPSRFKSALQKSIKINAFKYDIDLICDNTNLITDKILDFQPTKTHNIKNSNVSLFTNESKEETNNKNVSGLKKASKIGAKYKTLDLLRSKALDGMNDERGNIYYIF